MRYTAPILFLSLILSLLTGAEALALDVGLSEVAFEFPEGTPLGGYGSSLRRLKSPNLKRGKNHILFRPNEGTLDPVRAKAMVVRGPKAKILFMSLDLVGVTVELHEDLVKRLKNKGYTAENVWISATHTHQGPGALSKKFFWGAIAMDFYQKRVYTALMDGILKAVDQAEQKAVPSELRYTEFQTEGLTRNRRNPNRGTDPTARMIWVNSLTGKLRGGITLFSVHGIALDDDNLKFSADAPGGIEAGLRVAADQKALTENRYDPNDPAVFLFVNGAEGDISPNFFGEEGIREIGEKFAAQATPFLGKGKLLPDEWKMKQDSAYLGYAGMRLVNCLRDGRKKQKVLDYLEWFKIGLKRAFPQAAQLWMLDWGGLRIMSWPGEPTVTLGKRLSDASRAVRPDLKPWIFGLTNGHLSYFLTPEEFKEGLKHGGTEPCSSMYGPDGGMIIVETFQDLFCSK